MADEVVTPPPAVDEGQMPTGGEHEGKSPDGGTPPTPEEPKGRQYSEAYVKQLRAESAESRNRVDELEEKIKEFEDRDKSELEKLTERATAAEKRAAAAETQRLRFEVAAERGLDLKAAEFLHGSTREEIELRAEELASLLQDGSRKPVAGFDGGA